MSAAKHTRGPWRVSFTDETLVLAADQVLVATTLQDEDDYANNCDRRAADARLIAAAPDLLEAAKEALTQAEGCFFNHYPGDDPSQAAEPLHIAMLRAAIAKATHPSASRGDSESNPSRRQT